MFEFVAGYFNMGSFCENDFFCVVREERKLVIMKIGDGLNDLSADNESSYKLFFRFRLSLIFDHMKNLEIRFS
jgi:hypothetical protein